MKNTQEKKIEVVEYKYFKTITNILNSNKKQWLSYLSNKTDYKNDWHEIWNRIDNKSKNSDEGVGAERVFYWLFDKKTDWIPLSIPVGSDLMYETKDAIINIDIKTANPQTNKNDLKSTISLGWFQSSYKILYNVKKETRNFDAKLSTMYKNKVCLTFFITVIYDKFSMSIINVKLVSMANGKLTSIYKDNFIRAGRNRDSKNKLGKANFNNIRLNFKLTKYELLDNKPSRWINIHENK